MRTVFVVALLAAHMASARFIRATNAGREMVQDGLLGAASGSGGSSSSQTWTIVGSVAGALLCCYCCCRFCRNVRRHAEEQERRQRLQSSTPQPSYAVVPRSSQPSTGSSSTPGSYHVRCGSRALSASCCTGVQWIVHGLFSFSFFARAASRIECCGSAGSHGVCAMLQSLSINSSGRAWSRLCISRASARSAWSTRSTCRKCATASRS